MGSTSISYPAALINDIIKFQLGYKMWTDADFEPLPQGWELRALKEFRKLRQTFFKRLVCLMACKLALQMNLQITLLIINRRATGLKKELEILGLHFLQMRWEDLLADFRGKHYLSDLIGLASITCLVILTLTELKDTFEVLKLSYKVRKAVLERVSCVKCGPDSVYAHDDFMFRGQKEAVPHRASVLVEKRIASLTNSLQREFTTEEAEQTVGIFRITYNFQDLTKEYEWAVHGMCGIVALTAICMWLIGYALLKFVFAYICTSGAWSFQRGCLPTAQA